MKFLFFNFLSLQCVSILLDEEICEKSKFLRSDVERKGKDLAENWKFIVRLEIFGMSTGVKTPSEGSIVAREGRKLLQQYRTLFQSLYRCNNRQELDPYNCKMYQKRSVREDLLPAKDRQQADF